MNYKLKQISSLEKSGLNELKFALQRELER